MNTLLNSVLVSLVHLFTSADDRGVDGKEVIITCWSQEVRKKAVCIVRGMSCLRVAKFIRKDIITKHESVAHALSAVTMLLTSFAAENRSFK